MGSSSPKSCLGFVRIIHEGEGLQRWAEQGGALLKRRKAALKQFLSKLESSNPRPKKPRRAIKRKPIFQPGDCVAVRMPDGGWGAILILQGPRESDDPYVETYGINLAATLRYKGLDRPSLPVFEKREWLRWNHHGWRDYLHICNVTVLQFKTVKDRFVVVGNIPLRPDDPAHSKSYTTWPNTTDAMYIQDRWDRGIRD